MTVQELIGILEKCSDKTIPVKIYTFDGKNEMDCDVNYWGLSIIDFVIGHSEESEDT